MQNAIVTTDAANEDSDVFEELFDFPADCTGPACTMRVVVPSRAAYVESLAKVVRAARNNGGTLADMLDNIEIEHHQIWGAGLGLAALLRGLPLDGFQVCELGCGLGIGGIAATAAGAGAVVCTDLPAVVSDVASLLEKSATANNFGDRMCCKPLDWAQPHNFCEQICDATKGFDLVVGADILYGKKMGELLSALLAHSSVLAEGGLYIIVDSDRAYQAQALAAFREAGLSVRTQRLHTCVVADQELGKGQVISRMDTVIVGSKGQMLPHLFAVDAALRRLQAEGQEEASQVHPVHTRKELKVKVSNADIQQLLEMG
mmetsp:Transcript_28788/g.55423  ORF Transcript_28788/g.55423 Transcript_28788/m.55423 type:complete len:317 (+) Transcript_28788:47-997(+)|eukprot:CAMPEP_0172718314 /NCGR_PEP_ID=MMETSP1074-20121228/73979_1 /TAXON_ID=2916 /ORGANISM="Ceratium fusus, Strain PA161109" /LENGTH=316 /DNA_ID=CAMNT_0013543463 /DNA_START=36 /DNA_END=986 /DNA_ORIENTATION=+